MSKEKEVVILNINKKEIISKLKKLGAKKIYEGVLEDYVFDTPKNKLNKKNFILRVRKYSSKKYVLTLKKNPNFENNLKVRDEFEVVVSNFKNLKQILESLNYTNISILKKYRLSYKLEDTFFDIQDLLIKEIPTYLEIESTKITNINKYTKLLGFSKKDQTNFTLKKILKHYKIKKIN